MKQSALANLTQFMSNAPIEKTSLSMPPMAEPLMPHQVTGAEFALKERTVLIADEQGVGKTATAIAIATASVIAGMTPVLIVVPPSMRLQWTREFAKFSPSVSIATITGTNPVKHKITALPDADVLICGDASLDGWKNLMKNNVAESSLTSVSASRVASEQSDPKRVLRSRKQFHHRAFVLP